MTHITQIKIHLALIMVNLIIVAFSAVPLNLLVALYSVWIISRVSKKMWDEAVIHKRVVTEMIEKLNEMLPEDANEDDWTIVFGWQKKVDSPS